MRAYFLIRFSALTNKLMVRVTNYFETQVRVPTSDEQTSASSSRSSRSAFQAHMQGNTKMTDEQMVSWYGKILDSVRLRYRKLQRFARCGEICLICRPQILTSLQSSDPEIQQLCGVQLRGRPTRCLHRNSGSN